MSNITRGTTPTIKYKFKTAQVGDMAAAYVTINQLNQMIEYDLSQADVDTTENSLSWSLTQEDTLRIHAVNDKVKIQCRWKLIDGTAGASKIVTVLVDDILKGGVI